MSRPRTSLPDATRPVASERLRRQLQEHLLGLSTSAFEQLVAHLLRACGYQDVQVLGAGSRTSSTDFFPLRSPRPSLALSGGADLRAATTQGLARTVTIVQAKQYRRPVSRRFVDELRGAMLRSEAQQGLLLTTSTFNGPAYAAAQYGPLPIHLIEGSELLELLMAHRIGVEVRPSGRWHIDTEFWKQLQQESDQALRRPASPQTPSTRRPQPTQQEDVAVLRRGWCRFCRRLWPFTSPNTHKENR